MDGAGPSSRRGFRFRTPALDLLLYSDASRSGWGAHLLDHSRVRGVIGAGEVVPHLSSRIAGYLLALPSFQEGITSLRMPAMCDDSMVVAYINQQGGTVSRSLCSLASRLPRWSESLDLHLNTRYLPGKSYVLADLLNRRDQVIGAAWSLHLQVVTTLLRAWHSPSLALFMTRLTVVLPLCCSLIPDPRAVFEDAFRLPWATWVCTHFHPSSRRMGGGSSQRDPNLSMTLVAHLWPE